MYITNTSSKSSLDLRNVILFVLGCTSGVLRGKTRLHKILFLLKHEKGVGFECSFEKRLYGPYSEDIEKLLKILEDEDLIEIKEFNFIDLDTPQKEKGYVISLTTKGVEKFNKLFDHLLKQRHEIIHSIGYIITLNFMPLRELIKYIYVKYPEFKGHEPDNTSILL